MNDNKAIIFDSYAILALLKKENGANKVRELLKQAEIGAVNICLPVLILGEVFYILIREIGEKQAGDIIAKIENLAVEIIDIDLHLTKQAAKIKVDGRLSYSDSFVLALAIEKQGIIVTGDKEFAKFADRAEILWLDK